MALSGDLRMKKQQAGMTLIELVIVIIVLGIIAAVAAPKFADIQGNAATAAKEGSVGAVDSAYTIAIAKAQGTPTVTQLSAQISGMTCNGTTKCDTADKDGTAGVDVSAVFYTDDCTNKTATSAGTDLVKAYAFSYNGGAVADCREF